MPATLGLVHPAPSKLFVNGLGRRSQGKAIARPLLVFAQQANNWWGRSDHLWRTIKTEEEFTKALESANSSEKLLVVGTHLHHLPFVVLVPTAFLL
jgi:hypothetical protein